MIPSNVKATFNEVYANGSTTTPPHWAWVAGSSFRKIVSQQGYCAVAGWCSPKNFFWGYTEATNYPPEDTPIMRAKWIPNTQSNPTIVYAWIPNNNATAWSWYQGWINGGANIVGNFVDQEYYNNEWAYALGYFSNYTQVRLSNDNDIATYKTAWDETWFCSSDICP